MPSREDEEFELVLGNKQLLSLFFVVVVLFAVFFSFGYTVGFSRGQQDRVIAATSNPAPEPNRKWPMFASRTRCSKMRPSREKFYRRRRRP